jgi:hypothetical protein
MGYKVYRHKGRYFVYYDHSDPYPSHFGLKVLREIPHRRVSKEKFEEWVRLTREYLDEQYEELKNPDTCKYQPVGMGGWTYEIDLDNLVFHVDSQPIFRLDNSPPEDVFLKAISFDHFGHRAFHKHTPVEFRYDWRAPPPPPLPKSLIAYNSCLNRSSTSFVHELLCIPMALSSIERVRTTLVELLVTRCMTEYGVGHDVRVLESVPDRTHISQSVLKLGLSLVNFAVGPPIPSLPCNPYCNAWDFTWIRKDVCLRVTTHLDDEENLQASIGDLVHHINTTQHKVGTIYGIVCSIFHCAVVRVDKGTSFAHTRALQLLPSFYARKVSTPGIEALSRLGCQTSGVEFLTAISEAYNLSCITPELVVTRSMAAKVPVEVWMNVGHFITSPIDLVNLASISPQAMSAAADLARSPLVMGFRLVDVVGSISPIPETRESIYDEEEDVRLYYYQLGCSKFTAVKGASGRHVTVELGQEIPGGVAGHLSFELQTYISGPVVIMGNVYILEIDDDEPS